MTLPLLLAAVVAASPAPAASSRDAALRRATVQLFVVSRSPDYAAPWQYGRQQSLEASGVVIAGRRILTNGHVVANAAYVAVRKVGDVRRYPGRVAFAGHDGETAVITVDDPSFFEGIEPVALGGVPAPRDKVAVYGYPIGGEELSVTEGVVSRVGVTPYSHSARQLLAVQTDAAINAGNSGGPVFQEGRLVGIAFQHRTDQGAQSIGYVVPTPVIERFLADVSDGRYDGIPDLGVWWQRTENAALRRSLGLPDDRKGVLLTKVAFGGSGWGALREGDALVRLGGVDVGQDGTVALRGDERVDLSDLASRRQVGETLEAVVVREGRRLAVPVTLKPETDLVPGPRYDRRPTYLIVGGLVFMPLTDDLIAARGGNFLVRSLSADGSPTPERPEVAVLSHVLADEVNRGYQSLTMAPVTRVNGRPIARFADLVEAFKRPAEGRHEIELDHHAGFGENRGARVVLDAKAAKDGAPALLARYGVPSDRSEDLKEPAAVTAQ